MWGLRHEGWLTWKHVTCSSYIIWWQLCEEQYRKGRPPGLQSPMPVCNKVRAKQRCHWWVSQTQTTQRTGEQTNKFFYITPEEHESRTPGRPGRINCVRWLLMPVDSARRTCLWRLQFCGGSYIFRKFMHSQV